MSKRATILLATLKRTGLSNTETLCEFLWAIRINIVNDEYRPRPRWMCRDRAF